MDLNLSHGKRKKLMEKISKVECLEGNGTGVIAGVAIILAVVKIVDGVNKAKLKKKSASEKNPAPVVKRKPLVSAKNAKIAAKKEADAAKAAEEETEEEEDDDSIPEAFTDAMKKAIIKETKDKLSKITLTVAPEDYERVMASLGISEMNPGQLCNYAIDKFTRITAITPLIACAPTVTEMTLVYTPLLALASVGRGYMSTPDRTTMKTLKRTLNGMLQDNANSCAVACNGNKALFQLTGYGTRKTYTKQTGKLPACDAKTNNKKGAGNMGISCIPIAGAQNYRLYFGTTAEYDETWESVVGPSRQILEGLEKGVAYYFIMVAIGPTGEGEWMSPIKRSVPNA
jgi:hypothetical protein